MSRTNKSRNGKGELWSRRASAAKVNGHYNGPLVKKVTTHKERRAAHVAADTARRSAEKKS
jgi:hypothetical protein